MFTKIVKRIMGVKPVTDEKQKNALTELLVKAVNTGEKVAGISVSVQPGIFRSN
jgi:hypothetical protein